MDDKVLDGFFASSMEDFHTRLDLIGEHCHLKHSIQDSVKDHPAVDYLCQGFGKETTIDQGDTTNVEFIIKIPICQECVEALLGNEWILLYCTHCNSSQWVCRKYAKYQYPFWLHIKWMDKCPVCYPIKEIYDKDIND